MNLSVYILSILYFFADGDLILDGGSLKACPRPKTPKNAIISHLETHRTYPDGESSRGYGVDEYYELDRVYFQCRDGFSQGDFAILYTTCGSNGKWFPDLTEGKKCLPNRKYDRCQSGLFMCQSDNICISRHLRCDCYIDCADGSDEIGCESRQHFIEARTKGADSAGIISSPGYPLRYPKKFECKYHIKTMPGYRVELDFSEFDISGEVRGSCRDYVIIDGINYEKNKSGLRKVAPKRKCGNITSLGVISGTRQMWINVSLGNFNKYVRGYRGFALRWKVHSKQFVEKYVAIKSKIRAPIKRTTRKSENNYTLIAPIVIAAVIPTLLIVFICLSKHRMQTVYQICKQKNKSVKKRKEKNVNVANALLLTTENLERFNNQNLSDDKENSGTRALLPKENERHIQRSGHTNLSTSNTMFCKNENSDNSNSRHNNSIEKRQFGHTNEHKKLQNKLQQEAPTTSTDSDHPRYVLSYDILKKYTVSKQHKKHTQLESQRMLGQPKNICNRTPTHNLNNNTTYRPSTLMPVNCGTSKSSKESKDFGGGSSRNSKSTSHCTYCAHRKALQKPKRLSPVGFECQNLAESTDVTSGFEELHNFNEYKEEGNSPEQEKLFSLYNEAIEKTKHIPLNNTNYLSNKDNLKLFPDKNYRGEFNDIEGIPPRLCNVSTNNIIVMQSNNEVMDKVFYKTRGGSILCTH